MSNAPAGSGMAREAMHRLTFPSLVVGVGLVSLAIADLVLPLRTDLFGLSRVLAPYLALLFLPLVLLALLARGRDRRRLGLVAIVGILLAAMRFVPSMPAGVAAADPSAPRIHVATWNLYLDAVPPGTLLDALVDRAPGIVGIQELTPTRAAVIESDPKLRSAFPYQVLEPADDWSGMGLLSSWPIDGPIETSATPPLIATTIRPPHSSALDVLVAHAPPPRFGIGPLGPGYDPTRRDASLATLRHRLQAGIDDGRRVVLLGDLNVTDRELAYAEVIAGLIDSYRAAGSGLGHTWRPPVGPGLPFGMLRIDMVLTGPGATPVASMPDCTPRSSDHCILDVTIAVDPAD
jgi:vancomycin resistance protein VanJ